MISDAVIDGRRMDCMEDSRTGVNSQMKNVDFANILQLFLCWPNSPAPGAGKVAPARSRPAHEDGPGGIPGPSRRAGETSGREAAPAQ